MKAAPSLRKHVNGQLFKDSSSHLSTNNDILHHLERKIEELERQVNNRELSKSAITKSPQRVWEYNFSSDFLH
jgi:hypothetical protein